MGKKAQIVKNVYLDLDGTVVDVFPRLYAVYRDLLFSLDEKYLSYAEYFFLKKSGLNEEAILKKTTSDLEKIEKILDKRIRLLEQTKYLKIDKILDGVAEVLREMKKRYKLYLITQRWNRNNLLEQLRRLKIDDLFERVLSVIDKNSNSDRKSWKDKLKLILDQREEGIVNSVIIGDSIDDIKVGRALDFKVIVILTGVGIKEVLIKERPDFIVSNMKEAMKMLNG